MFQKENENMQLFNSAVAAHKCFQRPAKTIKAYPAKTQAQNYFSASNALKIKNQATATKSEPPSSMKEMNTNS